jgi:phytoene/squalene synthetase
VHIVRDFQSDHLQNLNYFTHDLMARHGLSRAQLQAMAEGGTILPGFRALVRDYRRLAGHYRQKTRAALDAVRHCLQPPYALSLEIIYELYLQIYERINPEAETFAAAGMVPSCAEVLTRVHEVINRFPTCAGLA